VRTEGGLICSLAEYPKGECAPILDDAEAQRIAQETAATPEPATAVGSAAASGAPAATPAAPADPGSPWATIAVAVILIVGAAWGSLTYRRRAMADRHG
jgi:hypothetical protein